MADERLGTDLAVVTGFVAHDAAQIDLAPRRRPIRGPALAGATEAIDLDTFGGRENLAQALILRLLTPRGSLAALGHGEYGSRLGELIGQRKTAALRNLCRAFVLEVVAQEPRVDDRAVDLSFDPESEDASTFVFTLVVQPRSGGDPLGLSLGVTL